MRLTIFTAAFLFAATSAFAQVRDSVFATYDDYSAFVDEKVMSRDFVTLVQSLGGRDEYTKEQLANINVNLLNAFPFDFKNAEVFREEDLGGGMRHEGRVFWTGESYAFFYAVMHDRGNELVVINFQLHSNIAEVMKRF